MVVWQNLCKTRNGKPPYAPYKQPYLLVPQFVHLTPKSRGNLYSSVVFLKEIVLVILPADENNNFVVLTSKHGFRYFSNSTISWLWSNACFTTVPICACCIAALCSWSEKRLIMADMKISWRYFHDGSAESLRSSNPEGRYNKEDRQPLFELQGPPVRKEVMDFLHIISYWILDIL